MYIIICKKDSFTIREFIIHFMSSSIREWIRENEQRDVCNYCGKREENLTIEHILPLSRGGPDHPDNTVWICKECNLIKSMKRLYEYFTLDMRDEIRPIAER